MKRILGCLLIALAISQFSEAQLTRYVVKFKDKGTNPYSLSNPLAYLSQKSIDRRTKYSIAIDSTDLPITPRYIDSVRLAGTVTILNRSKWLNSISIQTTDNAALTKINSFPFVQSVTAIAARTMNTTPGKFKDDPQPLSQFREMGVAADFFNYGSSFNQIHIHNGEFLHNIGLRGQNMVIGMLDAGFQNYLNVSSLDSARNNGQILGVYDFVVKDSSVTEDDAHGLECLSTIAANIPGQFVGTAPKAKFYLFRTEDNFSEYRIEELNWVCGAERVDSLGGDVISSSLGYSDHMSDPQFNHVYADMDGNTTMAAIGADLAAKKGILVVNAAGNDGNDTFHFIGTPADADSVMAVGAVNSSGVVAGFSSYGPSSDQQVKPDVASMGVSTIVQFPGGGIGGNNGTSFACPNLAGLTTCLWQGFPEYNNMKIINALRQAGSIASTPNNRIGYGVPDVKKALMGLVKEFATSSASVTNCTTTLTWTSKDVSSMKYEIERMLPGQSSFAKIGEQSGSGTVFSTRPSYQYQDVLSNVSAGTITYRIRQVIDTATASFAADYVDTATVILSSGCTTTGIPQVSNDNEIILSPNPANGQVTLKITTVNAIPNLVIRVFNSKGQEVSLLNKSKASGTATFDIPLVRFAKGKYYVSIYNDNKLIITKELIKL